VVNYAVYLSYCPLFITSPCLPDDAIAAYLEENPRSIFTTKLRYETCS
jgi:hypothetical protein